MTKPRRITADLVVGLRFNRWVVLEILETPGPRGMCMVKAQCDCGTIKAIRASTLRSGHSKSCGCYRRERMAQTQREYGTTHGMTNTDLYVCWQNMRKRCTDPTNKGFPNYGGRGITVCPEWNDSFEAFTRDMGPKPTPDHEIDRTNNEGNYEPGNCRWVTKTENLRNTRKTKSVTICGVTRRIPEWLQLHGIPMKTYRSRMDSRTWSIEEAVTTPPMPRGVRRKKAKAG